MLFNAFGGFLSDRFGRRRMMLTCAAIHAVFSFLTAFTSDRSLLLFIAVRFFVGGSIHAAWGAFFVLTMETTINDRRGLTGGVLNFGEEYIALNLWSGLRGYFARQSPT